MEWIDILDYLMKGLGSFAATLIITFASILFAKLKTKISEARLNAFIQQVVKAAEQKFPNMGTKTGPEKYAFVIEQVKLKFPKVKDDPTLNALVEGAVYTFINSGGEITKNITEEKKEQGIRVSF